MRTQVADRSQARGPPLVATQQPCSANVPCATRRHKAPVRAAARSSADCPTVVLIDNELDERMLRRWLPLEAYTQTIADNEMDVAAGHPLADAVLRFAKTGEWRGTAW